MLTSLKQYEVSISPIFDPIAFCSDIRRKILTRLESEYVGKCFGGAYILSIDSLVDYSACRISSTNTSGAGEVDVRFLAKVVSVAAGDILVGVDIIGTQTLVIGQWAPSVSGPEPHCAVCRVPFVSACVAAPTGMAPIVGQLAVVKVTNALHEPRLGISVTATVLDCDNTAFREHQAYSFGASADFGGSAEVLAPLLAAAVAELAAREVLLATRKADVWRVEGLLCARRPAAGGADQEIETEGARSWRGPPATPARMPQTKNVIDVARRAIESAGGAPVRVRGVWYRPPGTYLSSPVAARCSGPLPADWPAPIEATPTIAFAAMLKNIVDYLAAVREIVEVYLGPNVAPGAASYFAAWEAIRAARPQ